MDRFWNKVDRSGDCWVWTAGRDNAGYGQFRYEGKNIKAHRVSFFLANGTWPGICRHTCDNPPCVNPDHLLDGSHKDNSDDMYARERNSGLKKSDIVDIRNMPMTRTIVHDVADSYGISTRFARDILDGTVWKELPGARKVVKQKSRSKLSVEDIIEIKRELARDRYRGQVNDLARKYGVTHSQISHIRRGYVHSDVSVVTGVSIDGNINS